MTTKEKVLELFESNKDIYFSGEEIAKKLEVSRTAVWKAVKALQNEGYSIDAVTNKGYCLSAQTDILSAQGIQKYLRPELAKMEFHMLPTVESTNVWMRDQAAGGAKEGCMVLANEQTKGSGRKGRSFFSPQKTGIYMSLLLRPVNYTAQQAVRVTTMAAVAVCEAIEAVTGEKAEIKWVNDVYVRGKKVCGILTEGSFNLENGLLEYAVLGIGINLYQPENGFPEEIRDIAGAVLQTHQDDAKNRLVSEFLNRFFFYYKAEKQADYAEQYRNRCFVIGKEVSLVTASESRPALVLGIDEECHLQVRYADGTEESCFSGEISLRI